MNMKKIMLFTMVLLIGLTVVSAADVNETSQLTTQNTPTVYDTASEITSQSDNINTVNQQENTLQNTNDLVEEVDVTSDLTITDTSYNNKQLNVGSNVEVTSTVNLTNVRIVADGNNIKLTGLNITNTDFSDIVISVLSGSTNVNITNNVITTINNDERTTIAVKLNTTTHANITGNYITVAAVPQENVWVSTNVYGNYLDLCPVSAVELTHSQYINLTNNNLTVTNSTESLSSNATAEAIAIKNETKKSNITENNITINGSEYNYGIFSCFKISSVKINNNKIYLNGTNYICGIYCDYVSSSDIIGNTIRGKCYNTTLTTVSNEAFAYGIVVLTQYLIDDPTSTWNEISSNNILLNATIVYGVEGILTDTLDVSHNVFNLYGNKVAGITLTITTDSFVDYNTITIVSNNDRPLATVVEIIPPTTTGIYFLATEDEECGTVSNNIISVTETVSSEDIYSMIFDLTDIEDITDNYVQSSSVGNLKEGIDSIDDEDEDKDLSQNYPLSSYTPPSNSFLKSNNLKSNKNIKSSPQIITLNATTFDTYVTNGMFNDNVNEGDIIDVSGRLDGERFSLTVNKPVNITSLNNNSYISVYTISGKHTGIDFNGPIFQVISSGSNTNISNLVFNNTRIYINGTENVTIENIIVENGYAQHTGQFSLRGQANNITIKNSYFKTENNGGFSNFVLAGSRNVILENNTIEGIGRVGNLFYFCIYYGQVHENGYFNNNITLKSNTIRAINCESDICYGVALEGKNIIFENNTIIHKAGAVTTYSGNSENVTFLNNYIPYGYITPNGVNYTLINNTFNNVTSWNNTIIENNVINTLITENNNNVSNNIINNLVVKSNNFVENNTINIVDVTGDNVLLNNNTITNLNHNYSVKIINGSNITVINNNLSNNLTNGNDAVEGTCDLIENNVGSQYIFINDDNYLDYGSVKKTTYTLDHVEDNPIIQLQLSTFKTINIDKIAEDDPTKTFKITIINSGKDELPTVTSIKCDHVSVDFFNCYLPSVKLNSFRLSNVNVYNSTFERITSGSIGCSIGIIDKDSFTLRNTTTLESNTTSDGYLSGTDYPAKVYVSDFDKYDVIIDKSINLTRMGVGNINNSVTFIEGSEHSNVTGVTFNDKVYINTSNINFVNNTFNAGVVLTNAQGISLENNIIKANGEDVPLSFVNSVGNTVLFNNITGLNGITISFDDDSNNNIIQENLLDGTTKHNIDTINGNNNNTFLDNAELYDVTINIDVESTFYVGESVPVTVNVTNDFDGSPVENGYVEIYVDGIPQDTLNLTNGQASAYVTANRAVNYTRVKVWYYPTEKYATNNKANMVNILESTGSIVLEDILGSKIGEQITINARINSTDVVDEGNISFQFANQSISVPVTDNTASVTTIITATMLDDPTLRVVYEGKAMYAIKGNMTTLTITPGIANIVVDEVNGKIGDEVQLTTHIKDINDENIDGGLITYTNSQGETLATADIVDGTAATHYIFTSEYNGNIIATLTSDYYQSSTAENTAQIRKINTEVIITVPDSITTGTVINVTAQVKDENGNSVSGAPIALTIGQIQYPAMISNENGTLIMPTAIQSPDPVTVTASYAGNGTYSPSIDECIIKNRNKTTITMDEINTVVTIPTTITATLTSEDNSIINEGQVTFTLADGTVIDTVDVEDSQATTTYTFTNEMETTITASFTKTDNYINTTTTTALKVDQMPPKEYTIKVDTTEFTLGQSTTITASIYYGNEYEEELATNITKGKVTFKVNGKTLKDANGKVIYAKVINGVATIENYTVPDDWTKNNTSIQAVYTGSTQVESLSSKKTEISVTPVELTLATSDVTSTTGEEITLTATLNYNTINTGKVIFKINGKTVKDSNGKVIYAKVVNGEVSVNYIIPATMKIGNYNITATYMPTSGEKLTSEATLTVGKI